MHITTQPPASIVTEMPEYKCHKLVRAAKITGVALDDDTMTDQGAVTVLNFGDIGLSKTVYPDWVKKHEPKIGGYFVEYEDGYTSYSPAEAFESGYAKT